jgi:hypothetical protein
VIAHVLLGIAAGAVCLLFLAANALALMQWGANYERRKVVEFLRRGTESDRRAAQRIERRAHRLEFGPGGAPEDLGNDT